MFRVIYPLDSNGDSIESPVLLTADNHRITGGIMDSVFLVLQEMLGFSYTLLGVESTIYPWEKGLDELDANRSDMLVGWIMDTPHRRKLIDYAVPFSHEQVGVEVPVIGKRSQNLLHFEMFFTWNIWTVVLAIFVMSVIVDTLHHDLGSNPLDQ